ncbi:MAG TPA: hypothetical protein VGC54_02530 [Planctomycetota bacterium]
MNHDANTSLEIQTSFLPLPPWSQALVRPVIEIDGTCHKQYWGTHTFPVAPGPHTVRAWHRWFVFRRCHLSRIKLEVAENTTVRLRWATPVAVMAPGKWSRRDGPPRSTAKARRR